MLLLYKTHIFLLIYKDKTGSEIILQMSNYCLYARIDEVIKDRRADNEIEREIAEKKKCIGELLKGSGDIRSRSLNGRFVKDCGGMNDSEMLAAILQSCSEEVLPGLEREFGSESKISGIIREKLLNNAPPKLTKKPSPRWKICSKKARK